MKNTFSWPRGRPLLSGALAAALLLNLGANVVSAASSTWNGSGADDNWTTPQNWLGGVAPVAGASLIFDGSTRLTPSNNFAANTAWNAITFNSTAGSFTLIGNAAGLSTSITDNQGTLPQSIKFPVALASGGVTVSVASGGTLLLNGTLSGSGSINKAGAGLLILLGNETYAGNTTVSAGTLFVNGTLPPVSTVSVLPGATLGGLGTILGSITVQPNGVFSPGTNSIGIITASNVLTLSGVAQMEIDRSAALTSDRAVGMGTLSYGGTLNVVNVGPALQAGDCFTLFSAAKYNGSFSTISLPSLASGLAWDTSTLLRDGSICVVSVRDPNSCCQRKVWHTADTTGPIGRLGHAMAYDSIRGRVVMFGGSSSSGLLGDTWEWNGSSWSLVSSNGPSPRVSHAMAYDSRIGRTVLYGGLNATGPQSDTWLWDGANWTLATASGPGPRNAHAMAFDSSRGKTVLMGGVGSTGNELGDTWEFDGAGWSLVPSGAGSPGPRQGHSMAYDKTLGLTVLFGGLKGGTLFGDTWKYDGVSWTLANTNGPIPRAFSAMVYNENCDSVVLYGGGLSVSLPLSDTWEWSGGSWTLTGTNVPASRLEHAMAHDTAHHQTVLFGGSRGTQSWLNDTWLYGPLQVAPQILSAYVVCGDQKVTVAFSAPLDPVTAQNVGNYQIVCGPVVIGITKALLTDDARIVTLFTDQPINSNPLVGGCCSLSVNGVRDSCGNVLQQGGAPICCTTEPCSRGAAGTEYWLTFPGNYAPDPTNPPVVQLFIAGAAGTIGNASMPFATPAFSANFTIPASGVATVNLPRVADLADSNDLVTSNGVHVIASQPVSVYGFDHVKYTTDAYLGLSTKALGRTYLVMSYQNNFSGVPELNGSQLAIAAAVDNTTIFIVPSANVGTHPAGVPFNLSMMQGQTYQLRDTNDFPADLTGTIVVSDQPIAVFGSHQCANIPNSNTFFCDYIVEQMPPTDLWGINFFTVPLAGRLFGDTFHIMAMFNSTTVSVNGSAIPGTINRGQFYELQLINPSQITANKPVLVSQFSDSSDYDGVTNSDPFMVVIPPASLYASSYTVQSPTTDFGSNYINIVAPAAAVGQINLDGTALPAVSFTAIGATGYSWTRKAVGTGPHTLFSSNSLAFGVVVYGWDLYDSYGYPGGTCGNPQGQPPRFTCPPTNSTVQAGAGCVAPVPDFTAQVVNGNQAVYINQSPLPGTLVGPGTYTVTITIIDQFGTRQTCTTVLTVTPPSTSGLQCPQGIVTNCANQQGRVVTFLVGACNTNYSVVCVPPSGSLFPVGTTTVTCTATNSAGVVEKCTFPVTVNCLVLAVSQSRTNLTVTWQGPGTLQKATNVTGPWIPVPTVSNIFVTPFTGNRAFFRVLQ